MHSFCTETGGGMAFMTDVQELKPGLVIFRRTDVKHKNWYCRVRLPRQDRYKIISLKTPDIQEAQDKAFDHDADIRFRIRHEVPVFEKSFAQVAEEYLAFQRQAAEAGQITLGRWKIVKSYIDLHLIPYCGNHQITLIGEDKWKAYPFWRKKQVWSGGPEKTGARARKARQNAKPEKTGAKDGTIRQEMMIFRAIMNFAADKQYIRERQVPRGKLPQDKARREEFTPAEYRHLHTTARTWIKKAETDRARWNRAMAYNFMLVMANTGMRTMEARNLRWRDVDVRKDRQGRKFVCLNVHGKGKYRELVAAGNVAEYLERIRALIEEAKAAREAKAGKKPEAEAESDGGDALAHGGKDGSETDENDKAKQADDFVFVKYDGKPGARLYNDQIEDLLDQAGLLETASGGRRSAYCFRHTYATFRLKEGVDVYFLAKQMGTSVKMIEDYYGHITPSKNTDAILQGMPGWEQITEKADGKDKGASEGEDETGAAEAEGVSGTKLRAKARKRTAKTAHGTTRVRATSDGR